MDEWQSLIHELTEKSLSAVNRGHFQTAVTHLEQVAGYLRRESQNQAVKKDLTEVLFNLGLYYQQLGEYATAVIHLEEVVRLDSELNSPYLSADQTVLAELRQLAAMTPAERMVELTLTDQMHDQLAALAETEREALQMGALRAVMLTLVDNPLPPHAENEQLAQRLEEAIGYVVQDESMGETRRSFVAYLQGVIAQLRK